MVHHARVPSVLQKPPFVPKKHLKVTKPIDFCLNTEKRAKEREEFDEHMKQKEMERLDMLNKASFGKEISSALTTQSLLALFFFTA